MHARFCLPCHSRKNSEADDSQNRRLNSFFLETSCAVLLYDSLCHSSKHPNNREYIDIAVSCLREIVGEVPAENTALSVGRILQAVERSISPAVPVNASSDGVGLASTYAGNNPHNSQILSFDGAPPNTSQDLIFFGDRGVEASAGASTMAPPNAEELGGGGQGLSQLDFDVMTTNICNLFTMEPMSL